MSPNDLIIKVQTELSDIQTGVIEALTMSKDLRVSDRINGFETNGFDIYNSDDLTPAIEFVNQLIEINNN
jgi:hypothetical protein